MGSPAMRDSRRLGHPDLAYNPLPRHPLPQEMDY